MPYFVIEGRNKKEPVARMPGIARLTIDNLLEEILEVKQLGISRVLLFGALGSIRIIWQVMPMPKIILYLGQ